MWAQDPSLRLQYHVTIRIPQTPSSNTHIFIKPAQRKMLDVLCLCYLSLRPTKQNLSFAEKMLSNFESNSILWYVEYNSEEIKSE